MVDFDQYFQFLPSLDNVLFLSWDGLLPQLERLKTQLECFCCCVPCYRYFVARKYRAALYFNRARRVTIPDVLFYVFVVCLVGARAVTIWVVGGLFTCALGFGLGLGLEIFYRIN